MDSSRSLKKFPVVQHALVVGGGPAGAKAASDIAACGIPVTLVETAETLPVFAQPCAVPTIGAAAAPKAPAKSTQAPDPAGRKTSPQPGADSGREQLVAFLADRLQSANKVRVLVSTTISRVHGRVGDFTVELSRPEPAAASEKKRCLVQEELRVGAIVVALEGPRTSIKELAALRNGKNVLGIGELCAAVNLKAHLPREV
ncbi:MAG: FAD-dependent oxidoreductase, partial [Planctomycetota bacterium]|nr:FAD-dependent oxidoreductase [Planctomycetota bacterium]